MKKEEIFTKLKSLNLDYDNCIIIGGASLVVQDLFEETSDIDFACTKEYYNSIDWDYDSTIDDGTVLKVKDCYSISNTFYDSENYIIINGYKFMTVEKVYEIKLGLNRKKDQKIIKKLDLYLCQKDNYRYERKLKEKGVSFIAGVDEVGRGPLVGPVVAACVVLPDNYDLDGLTDSKKLSEKKRDYFYDKIKKQALGVGVGVISEKIIDEVNIYEATKMAMKEAINNCLKNCKIEHILIDAMPLDLDIPTTSIIKGDLKSVTISAASVIAKVTRDKMLYELGEKYPMYDFRHNVGYPTRKHLDAISNYGIIPEHRRSYGPVRDYIMNNQKENLV